MKKLYTSMLLAALVATTYAQTTVFSDDFDSGLSAWTLTGDWGLDSTESVNGTFCLADSPYGIYLNALNSTATITNSFDLSSALDANVHFQVKYDIENGFDYCYVDMSSNNGSTWTQIGVFNGENVLSSWLPVTFNAGGFVGNSQVKFRFRWYSDAGYQADGIYIDSLRITSDTVDNAPPLIVHNPDEHYEGQLDTNTRVVQITDISGVASAILYYQVDSGSVLTINPSDTIGDDFIFHIPPQAPGSYVDYWISATDSSPASNTGFSQIYSYIAGRYVKHENGVVNFVASYSSTGLYTGTAMRISLGGFTQVVSALIRNYTDINNPNDSIEVHVWSNNNNNPGTDLIAPITVFPAANLLQPQLITRLDLRPYASQLDSLSGSIFIGFIVPSGTAWVTQTTPGTTSRVRNWNGSTWSAESDDFHFRVVTDSVVQPPIANFGYNLSGDPTVVFSDSSSSSTTNWYWEFGDGSVDSVQNPTHTYASTGFQQTCLTASNVAGSNQICKTFLINNSKPTAQFIIDANNDPEIVFTDVSLNNPTSWDWDFGDGAIDTAQNPVHMYQDTGNYQVCLVASNGFGSDTVCQSVYINNQLPIAFFSHSILSMNLVKFTDLSTGLPDSWDWDFDHNSGTSNDQDPIYGYPLNGGTFNVCLVVSNSFGSSDAYCDEVEVPDLTIGIEGLTEGEIKIMPNPAHSFVQIQAPTQLNMQANDLSVVDLKGARLDLNVIRVAEGFNINVEQLPNGLYFVQWESAQGAIQFPFVKQ